MKSNYRKLGDYIQEIDKRNVEGKEENLLGVTTQKYFFPSIANTVGTDFTNYKIVKRNQFTYVSDTSRRGDRIGIALLDTYDEGLVSNIYTVFEVKDTKKLLPEYLMMWFRRPEFDRYARFKSHGSVREIFDWEEMCNVELPVPDITEQRKIVKVYQTITDRIALKRQINEKLEITAQAVFGEMFVSSNSCVNGTLLDLMDFKNGKSRPDKIGNIPVYGGNGVLSYTNISNANNVVIIGRVGAYCGSLFLELGKCWVSDNAISAQSKDFNEEYFDYYLLKSLSLTEHHIGTGQPLLTQGILNAIEAPLPDSKKTSEFNRCLKPIHKRMMGNIMEIRYLQKICDMLLLKMVKDI